MFAPYLLRVFHALPTARLLGSGSFALVIHAWRRSEKSSANHWRQSASLTCPVGSRIAQDGLCGASGGRVAEWSIAPVLKTGDVQASVGSNPTPSATCPRESVLPIRLRPDFSVVFEGYAGGAVNRATPRRARMRSLLAGILRTCRIFING